MNAKEAKALADKHNESVAAQKKIRQENQESADVNLLYNHLCDKVEQAVKAGKHSTESAGIEIKFPQERFANEIISDVVNKLRQDGYNVNKETHNAWKTIAFTISWV